MPFTRRQFLGTTASAAIAAGLTTRSSVFGANDRIGVCCVGVHGRGGNHIRNFLTGGESDVVALCDVDRNVLEARANQIQEHTGKRPKTYTDMREAFADPDVDVASIATPNHWHTLAAVWAIEAGKDVYVEKPLSHNVWEGRQLARLAAKSDRIVQHGTQNRSIPSWQWAIQRMRDGIIGDIFLARALCYKERDDIGKGEQVAAPDFLDYSLWQGPRPERPYLRRKPGTGNPDRHAIDDGVGGLFIHYNWHWFWDYGNGDIGNQGVHQMDVATWALDKGLPCTVYSAGGRYGYDDDGETPNTMSTTFTYDDGTTLEFAVRGRATNGEGPVTIGNLFYGSGGWGYIAEWKVGFYDQTGKLIEEVPEFPAPEEGRPDIQYERFLQAVRSRDKGDIPATAEEGHISSAHCHLANISYRLGRSLTLDPIQETFIGDAEADALLKDEYRPGFEFPAVDA